MAGVALELVIQPNVPSGFPPGRQSRACPWPVQERCLHSATVPLAREKPFLRLSPATAPLALAAPSTRAGGCQQPGSPSPPSLAGIHRWQHGLSLAFAPWAVCCCSLRSARAVPQSGETMREEDNDETLAFLHSHINCLRSGFFSTTMRTRNFVASSR